LALQALVLCLLFNILDVAKEIHRRISVFSF
jgi:hypothetical protein